MTPIKRLLPLFLILVLAACHRSAPPTAKRYPFTGRIESIDAPSETAIVDGDAIAGFMDAMAMPYKFRPSTVLRQLQPGDSISGTVVVVQPDPSSENAAPDYWIESVKITAHAPAPPASASDAFHTPSPGEEVPDFGFTNQDGKKTSFHKYRGKTLIVTFIYTRCPFPDFCPRMSGNFLEISKQLGTTPGLSNVHLLSLTFDPGYDTPKVLRAYGFSVAHTQEVSLFKQWEFGAPFDDDLPAVEKFFGLSVKPEGGLITHNLSTAVIGPDGKISTWHHGGDWQVSDLIKEAAAAGSAKTM